MPAHIRFFFVVMALAIMVGALLVNRSSRAGELPAAPAVVILQPPPVEEVAREPHDKPLPDFSAFRDAQAKKRAFIAYLAPVIQRQNQRLLWERDQIEAMSAVVGAGGVLDRGQRALLSELAERYRVQHDRTRTARTIELLLRRVDIVPVSLALIQSASESGWGTSRFAREANNLFGEKCFREGCGIASRHQSASQEFARFDLPGDAVASYMHNLNTHSAYLDFRRLRKRLREEEQPLTGTALAPGLLRYSERGEQYVQELRRMIRGNELERLDQS